jgi:hypothetical protein
MFRRTLTVLFFAACGTDPSVEPTSTSSEGLAATCQTPIVLPGTAMVDGQSITSWTKAWWRWTFAVPAAKNPELILDADCGVGQHDDVFFVPAYDGSTTYSRTCRVPRAAMPVLVPLWALINDYPCPDPDFHPGPGQSLEDFLTEGVVGLNDTTQNLAVTVDGRPVDVTSHRHTTPLFQFTADQSLVGVLPDACLQGTRQPGVSDGWWLMLQLPSGKHEVHVTAISPFGPIDYRYQLTVGR